MTKLGFNSLGNLHSISSKFLFMQDFSQSPFRFCTLFKIHTAKVCFYNAWFVVNNDWFSGCKPGIAMSIESLQLFEREDRISIHCVHIKLETIS